MSISKKILTAALAFLSAVCIAVALLLTPLFTSAAEPQEVAGEAHFTIEGGEFKGLNAEGIKKVGKQPSKILIPENLVTKIASGGTEGVSTLFGEAAPYIVEIEFEKASQITSIGSRAFAGLNKLTGINLDLATSLETVGDGAFEGCSSLTGLSIASSTVKAVPANFAKGCVSLSSLTLTNVIEVIGESAFEGCTSLTSFRMPENVKTIGNFAFKGNKFDAVTLPQTLTSIGKEAFNGCIKITELTIPSGVRNIGADAFKECSAIKTINYLAENATVEGGGNPFSLSQAAYAQSSVTVNIGNVTVLPQLLFCKKETVGDNTVYSGHKGIKQVNFNDVNLNGVLGFGADAFANCSSLEKVTFTNCSVSVINSGAFSGCTSLNTIEGLENISLQTIKENAFANCSALLRVLIGTTVTSIENNAFVGCERLVEVVDLSSALTITKGSAENGRVAENALKVQTVKDSTIIDRDTVTDYVFAAAEKNYLLGYTGEDNSITLPANYNGSTYDVYKLAFSDNVKLTDVNMQNSSISEIGAKAFANCTSLKNIVFSKETVSLGNYLLENCALLKKVDFNGNVKIKAIKQGTFKGCNALETITLPLNVETVEFQAFKNCSHLVTVNFTKTDKVTPAALKQIGNSAFEDCIQLKGISLADTNLTAIGDNAFKGCTSLSFVELPSLPDSGTYGANLFDGCAEDLLLISTDKEQFAKDKVKLSQYANKLTYIVKLNLIYQENGVVDGVHTTDRLFGKSAGYVKGDYSWIETAAMPIQSGYSVSRWYSDNTYASDKRITLADLTQKLGVTGVEEINIYAPYVEKPALQPKLGDSAPAYEEGMTWRYEAVIKNCFLINNQPISSFDYDKFTLNVTSHTFENGEADTSWSFSRDGVNQAGNYTGVLTLNEEKYGAWSSPLELRFRVQPKVIDVTDKIIWRPDGTGTLLPELAGDETVLYFNDGDSVPYIEKGDGESIKSVTVVNSYVLFVNKEISIHLDWRGAQYGEVVSDSYKNISGTTAGTYKAEVVLKPTNNFKFKSYKEGELTAEQAERLAKLGLTFRQDGENFVVTKTWYIAISKGNQLVNGDGEPYTIPDGTLWNYLETVSSVLNNPPEALLGNGKAAVTFALTLDGKTVGEAKAVNGKGLAISNYYSYINSSMPAGNYEITFFISAYEDNGQIVSGNTNGYKYAFTVGKAKLADYETEAAKRGLPDAALPYNGFVQFASVGGVGLLDAEHPTRPQADRSGIWEEEEFDGYYKNFTINYFVKAGPKKDNTQLPNNYYPESAYPDGAEGAIPSKEGVYTVFYRIFAPNFETAVEGKYELKITLTLQMPTVGDVDFTRASVLNDVKTMLLKQLPDKERAGYTTIYSLSDEDKNDVPQDLRNRYSGGSFDSYVTLGYHYVFILINKDVKDFILWDKAIVADNYTSSNLGGSYRSDILIIKFKIAATEREVKPLTVNRWQYGEFDKDYHQPTWELLFNRDYNSYWFELVSNDNPNDIYYFYPDGREFGVNELGFDKAPAGQYTLWAHAPGDTVSGINEFTSYCEATVDKAELRFSEMPLIDSWNYGNYTAEHVAPEFKLGGLGYEVKDKLQLKYCVETDYNSSNPASSKLKDIGALLIDGQLPVGTYYLVYTLTETDNFQSWSYGIRFRVNPAQNYWDTSPIIHDWLFGEYSSDNLNIVCRPHFGKTESVKFSFKNDGNLTTWQPSIEKLNGFDPVTKQLGVGTYHFKAELPASGNYGALTFETMFTVIPAQNSWVTVPGIKGWAEGRYSSDNKPAAEAQFGNESIVYRVTDESGEKVYYDSANGDTLSKLNSLKIGTYKLTATIIGNDNYGTLTSEVYFNVVEDSLGITGLMVAMIIFSVIAVALAVTGIVLLIRRNKKAEAEFRKAVRNELRRK